MMERYQNDARMGLTMLILILALSLSADALGAGLSFGARNIKIPISSKTVIGALSMCFAYLSLFFGNKLAQFIAPETATFLGSGILIAMALWVILFRVVKGKRAEEEIRDLPEGTMSVLRDPEKGDMDHSGAIDLKEATILGLALSVDILSAGTGLVLSGVRSILLPPVAGMTQILLLILGETAGNRPIIYLRSSTTESFHLSRL